MDTTLVEHRCLDLVWQWRPSQTVQAHQPWLRGVVALLSPSAVHVVAAATLQLHLLSTRKSRGRA